MRHNRASNVIADILLEDETIGGLVDGLPVIDVDAEPEMDNKCGNHGY
jgi:hypothetical protein